MYQQGRTAFELSDFEVDTIAMRSIVRGWRLGSFGMSRRSVLDVVAILALVVDLVAALEVFAAALDGGGRLECTQWRIVMMIMKMVGWAA